MRSNALMPAVQMRSWSSRRFREYRRFIALRACWAIMRGESVAWNLAFPDVPFTISATDGRLFTAGCTIGGESLEPKHLYHGDPDAGGEDQAEYRG